MPKRWLSRRERPRDNDLAQVAPSNNDQDFDFAFTNSPGALPNVAPIVTALPPTSEKESMGSAATRAEDGRSRKKLHINLPQMRPRSSDGHRASMLYRSHRASRSLDDLIGLAFGSPGHPPSTFPSLAAPLHAEQPEPAPRPRGPFGLSTKGPHLQPINWKKLGAMIRNRSGFAKAKDHSIVEAPVRPPIEQQKIHDQPVPKKSALKSRPVVPEHPTANPPPVPAIEVQPRPQCKEKSVLLGPSPPSSAELPLPRRQLAERPTRISSLPRLEVEIPSQPIDRYTVIMSNLPNASQSSSLLARRSKAAESWASPDTSSRNASTSDGSVFAEERALNKSDGEVLLARRMTSPMMPKPPFAAGRPEATPSPTANKYSLFPAQSPAHIKIVGRMPLESTLKRSATSPARLSPMQEHFTSSTKPQPLSVKPSPEDNPLSSSTERTDVWSTNHSLQSSVSSSSTTMEEIFFDIKSFRDSKGVEDGQQFVINRPDSAVVQLARSRSKVNASSRPHKQPNEQLPGTNKPTLSSLRNELLDKHASVNTVNTAVFDEVIAAVEQLATPTSAKEKQTASASGHRPESRHGTRDLSMTKAELEMKLLPPDPVLPMRSARDQVLRTIPSPVPEEISPLRTAAASKIGDQRPVSPSSNWNKGTRPVSPVSPLSMAPKKKQATSEEAPQPSQDLKAVTAESPSESKESSPLRESRKPAQVAAIASIKRVDTPIEDSPTIPQGPPPRKPVPITRNETEEKPPPVPKKDAKYIPISKFAARNTLSKAEQAGLRPARLTRAATDTIVNSSPPTSQQQQKHTRLTGRSERSATLPIPQAQQQARNSPQSNLSDFGHRMQNSTDKEKSDSPTVAAVVQVKPTAEVSVARTVSLSRKQSARVLVPGPRLSARRAADRDGNDSGTGTPNTIISAANSPAIGADSPRANQEQLKPKVVELQPREVTVRPNPLRSHPSPPSMVLTDVPAVVATAGTATPPAPVRKAPEDPDKEKAREKIRLMKEQARQKIAKTTAEAAERSKQQHITGTDYDSKRSSAENANPLTNAEQKMKDREMIEKYKEKDKTKWEIMEKRALSPVVMEGERRYGHKQGLSVGIVLESA